MEAILVPIALFAMIPAIVWAISHYKHKTQKAHADILTALVNNGTVITPELIESLGVQKKPKHHDLRRGIILTATAISMVLFAYFMPDKDTQSPLTGLAMIPLFIGLAYIGLWALISRKD